MKNFQFTEDQKLNVEILMESFNDQNLFCIPAFNKKTKQMEVVLTVIEDETLIPLGVLFIPGEDISDQFEFEGDKEDNVSYERPTVWERFKNLFRKGQ